MRCRNTLSPGKEQPISSGLHQRNEASKGIGRFDKLVGKYDMLLMQYAILLFFRFFFSGSGETERYTKVSGGRDQIPWKCIPKQVMCCQTFCCNNHPPGFLVPVQEMEEMEEVGVGGGRRREEGGGRTMWFRLRRWRRWRRWRSSSN